MATNKTLTVNDALGERAEDTKRVVLPESYYPVSLSLGALGTTDLRMDPVKDKQGNVVNDENGQPVLEEKGGVPFTEITASVYDGPFAGIDVQQKFYFSPGKGGGGLGLALGATKAITRAGANTLSVCQAFGVALPSALPGQTPKEYSAVIRATIAEAFFAMEPAKRLDFVAKLLNLPAWDGKKIVAKLKVETRNFVREDGTPGSFSSNQLSGFFPVDDKDKGVAFCKTHEFGKQQEAYDAMVAAGLI